MIKESNKSPIDIHAIPDGQFHFTEEQKQLLAEFENNCPLVADNLEDMIIYYDRLVRHYLPVDDFNDKAFKRYQMGIREEWLLLAIQKYQTDVLKLIQPILAYWGSRAYWGQDKWRKSDYPKIRNNFKFLDSYFHTDILDYLISYADEEAVITKFLLNWLDRFPLFTLAYLLVKFPTLTNSQKIPIKTLITNYLSANLAQIPPLKAQLNSEQLDLLNGMISHITEDMISQATSEPAMTTSTKSTAKIKTDNIPKPLKFPDLPLARIASEQRFNAEVTKLNHWARIKPHQHEIDKVTKIISQPDNYLFKIYEDVDEQDIQYELAILKAQYEQASIEQKYLAYLFVRPSVIFSKDYPQYAAGKASFDIADCLYTVDKVQQAAFRADLNNPDYSNRKYYNYQYDIATIVKLLPYGLQQALLSGNYLETYFDKYISSYSSCVTSLNDSLLNFMDKGQGEAIDTVVQKYYPYFTRDKYWHLLTDPITSYQVVPMYLNAFNTKTNQHLMSAYFNRNPQTVMDETVYLLFTKQTHETLKKAKKNAKAFFDYLIENHRTELIATLQAYDKQLSKPILVDFLTAYIVQQYSQSEQLSAAKAVDPNTLTTDNDGVPMLLLGNDWLKLTNRKSVTLPTNHILTDLPSLVLTSNNEKLPLAAEQNLLKMLYISELGNPFVQLVQLLQFFTNDSQQAFAKALWDKAEAVGKDKWFKGASAWLYRDDMADTINQSVKDYEGGVWSRSPKPVMTEFMILAEYTVTRHQLAKQGIDTEHNQKLGDDAMRLLIRLSQKARPSLRPTAIEQVKRYADMMGMTADDLVDRLMPTLGLDAHGKRLFDYGSRQFTLRFNINLEPEFTDNYDKKIKKLPAIAASDDEVMATKAVNDFKALKKALTAFKKDDISRIEQMMLSQRRMKFADFEQFYVKNPLVLRYTTQLIWGIYDNDGAESATTNSKNRLLMPFRVVETGEMLDIHDDVLTIAADSQIGLVHPLELTDEQKAKFGQALQDENIIQPILQLARPTFTLSDDEKTTGKITRFEQEKFATGSLIGLKNKGWEGGQIGGGVVSYYDKRLAGSDWSFSFTGFYLGEGVPKDDKGQQLEPIDIPNGANAVSVSEFLYVIDSMARI